MTDRFSALRRHVETTAIKQGIDPQLATRKFSDFDTYAQEAAERLSIAVDSDTARSYASLRLMETSLLEKQMLGKPVDASELLRVQDALKAIVPEERPMLHRVEIQLVGTFCPKCKERYDQPTLPPPIEPVVKGVTPATPDVVTATDEARILHPDKIDVPVKRVRHNEPEPPMFSACTIGKGVQTSDRWTR